MVGKWHVTPITETGPGGPFDGGPLGMVNAMGPFNLLPESLATKIARIDDIGGPDTHTNFPHGWAMAANAPVKRYKQNTHGGDIRDPLIVSWPQGLPARAELRHPFCHARDLAPTLLDLGDHRRRRHARDGGRATRCFLLRHADERELRAARCAARTGTADPAWALPVRRLESRCGSSGPDGKLAEQHLPAARLLRDALASAALQLDAVIEDRPGA